MTTITLNVDFGYRRTALLLDLDPERDQSAFSLLGNGILYEQDVAHVLMHALRPGDIAVDVGANVGIFTALMGVLVRPGGHVVAFEPDEQNIARLRNNLALNQLDNVTIVPQPATDRAGPVRFWINSDTSGGNALWDPGDFPGNTKSQATPLVHEVIGTTLDGELRRLGLPAPRLIKIDTEGAEHQVLAGARTLLSQAAVPYVIAELHEFGLAKLGSSQEVLRGLMRDHGYDTFALYFDGLLPKLIPDSTALRSRYFINLLFSTAGRLGEIWAAELHESLPAAMQQQGAG